MESTVAATPADASHTDTLRMINRVKQAQAGSF
jgi:hypothetical protein